MAEYREEVRAELQSHAQAAREAAVEAARQMAILWEARLNLAMATGDTDIVRNVISDRMMNSYMDNCDCGGGTGSSFFR